MTAPTVEFWVPGVPVPQGSKRAFVHRSTGRAVMVEANAQTRPWRMDVAIIARLRMGLAAPVAGAVNVDCLFIFTRPRSHFTRKGALTRSAPTQKSTRPDVDKLARAVLDAITGIVIVDDAQVVALTARKRWGDQPGAHVTVTALEVHE